MAESGGKVNETEQHLYAETIHKVLRFHRALFLYSRRMHITGISGRKVAALRYLIEAGPRTIGELRDYHHISDSTTSEMMAQLERSGFVTRTRSEADNRVVVVEITQSGREFAENAPLGGIPLLRERLKALAPERLKIIDQALTDLLTILASADENVSDQRENGQDAGIRASESSTARDT
jgi:DNA-binding MarR family transcriptional regulator